MNGTTLAPKIQDALDALNGGDLDRFMEFWSDDVVLRIGGDSRIAGIYRGRAAMKEVAIRSFEYGGNYQMELVDVLAGDREAAIIFHMTGENPKGVSIDTTNATVLTVGSDGKWDSCWWLPSDQQQYDAFFS